MDNSFIADVVKLLCGNKRDQQRGEEVMLTLSAATKQRVQAVLEMPEKSRLAFIAAN